MSSETGVVVSESDIELAATLTSEAPHCRKMLSALVVDSLWGVETGSIKCSLSDCVSANE